MNDELATIADDVLYKAIEDVTGLHFSGVDDAEINAFSVVLDKVLTNERTADEFAQRVAAYSKLGASISFSTIDKYHNIRLRTMKVPAGLTDPTTDDYPSEACHSSPTKVAEA